MGIRMTTTRQEIEAYAKKRLDAMIEAEIFQLNYIGERCVNVARRFHTYTDRTGNLTSSIGYVVSLDGKIVRESGFSQVLSGTEGGKDGKSYARNIASSIGSGQSALIVVAGMNYAYYVKAKGFDVLDSAEIIAEKLVKQLAAR